MGLLDGLRTLLDDLGTLGEDHLDVAWVGHVWVDLVMVSRLPSRQTLERALLTLPWAR